MRTVCVNLVALADLSYLTLDAKLLKVEKVMFGSQELSFEVKQYEQYYKNLGDQLIIQLPNQM